MLPTALKKTLAPSLAGGFVLKRSVFQRCLELWPMAEWDLMMQKVNKLNRFVKKNNDFIRKFTAGVKMIEVDSTGRILLPKDLKAFASIEKEVVLNGAVNILEIWDTQGYEEAIDDDGDFAELAEDVMGGINDLPDGIS
mgnify:FL=1|tara:strand:+ start:7222 stop:7638 length:417 start_codon:yes stop_codon:yes gene_type:complete